MREDLPLTFFSFQRGRSRLASFFLLSAAMLFVAVDSAAQLPFQRSSSSMLSAEEAFRAAAISNNDGTLLLTFQIARGYYLYRDRIAISAGSSEILLGFPELPEGEIYEDQFFGRTHIYRDWVNFTLPLQLTEAAPEEFILQVNSQGCSESPAVCYPPQRHQLLVTVAADVQRVLTEPLQPLLNEQPTDDFTALYGKPHQERLAERLAGGNFIVTLLVFFGLGILLTFTPCILPMLPIVAGLIAGGRGRAGQSNRAILLTAVYVLCMALSYALSGVAAAIAGASLQAALQQPWVIAAVVAIIVLLALSMFDLWQLQWPLPIRNLLDKLQRSAVGGSYGGAALMGVLSALVLSPCVSPPLIGALLYIATTGDMLLGGTALFVMGLGLGVPLLAMAASADWLLPRLGSWMQRIKVLLGLLLLALALWLLQRFFSNPVVSSVVVLAGWAMLLFIAGMWLWQFSAGIKRLQPLGRGVALMVLLLGVYYLVCAFLAIDFLRPEKRADFLLENSSRQVVEFRDIDNIGELQSLVAKAEKPVMLEVYADWCISCKEMEAFTFTDSRVQELLADMELLRADVTANDSTDKALLRELGLFAPPAMVFFARGQEVQGSRIVGFMGADKFATELKNILAYSRGVE